MLRVFVGLVLGYGVVAAAAFVTGLLIDDPQSFRLHFALGLFTVLFTCFLYSVVLTYFIITGKLVKAAVLKGHLDAGYVASSQRFKGRLSGMIVLAVSATLAAALVGAAHLPPGGPYGEHGTWHLISECFAVAVNAITLYITFVLIVRNRRLVTEVYEVHPWGAHPGAGRRG